MAIIARRIPHPLSGAADCGPNQQWDPNYVMPGLPPGQCTPKGSPMTPAPAPGFFDSFMSAMFPKSATPTASPPFMPPQPSGMSQGTLIALGLGAVGLLAIVLVATRK
jgi:hypothetical protein